MAYAFPARPTFRTLKESSYASDYITNKKGIIAFCKDKRDFKCKKSWSQGDYSIYNNGQNTINNLCSSKFNSANLNYNLLTKLNLNGVNTFNESYNNRCSLNNNVEYAVPSIQGI